MTGRLDMLVHDRSSVSARPRQRLFHAGYDHSEKDRHDIALLDRVSAESVPPVSETSGK